MYKTTFWWCWESKLKVQNQRCTRDQSITIWKVWIFARSQKFKMWISRAFQSTQIKAKILKWLNNIGLALLVSHWGTERWTLVGHARVARTLSQPLRRQKSGRKKWSWLTDSSSFDNFEKHRNRIFAMVASPYNIRMRDLFAWWPWLQKRGNFYSPVLHLVFFNFMT